VSGEHARRVRAERSEALRKLRSGELSLRKVLTRTPVALQEADAYEVFIAARGLGKEGCRLVFERAGVWPHRIMDELSREHRTALARELPSRVA
jgi:hypothetical protein